jgi:excinuclease ABC subunit A
MANAQSITGQYLAGAKSIELPAQRRRVAKSRSIILEGASANNLKQIDVKIPLGTMVCITGVSGSGKSTLVNETLSRALRRRLQGEGPRPGAHTSLRGVNQIDKIIDVDQTPIGRTSRSNPATYTGAFDEIRKVFAGTREARQRGFKTGRFSFNVKGGRCEECQGYGIKKVEMNFLPDLIITCPECNGARFNRQTLQVRYPLSGGEAQRIKLATELARVETGSTLYVLDEPTTGLHFDDVRNLLGVLNRLVDLGKLVIEHNLDVIKSADWLIDLGPEGGEQGGYLLAEGTPEEIAAIDGNATGTFLRHVLN